jgi:NADH dehydrogenase (ubiquinone) 1 alpha subcomplex subunit 5
MFRQTRPLLQQLVRKKVSTGLTGLAVHPNPLPELTKTYESTLTALKSLPSTSVYRQSVEALTQNKLRIVQEAAGDVASAEKQLDEGQIEESIDIANDELKLVSQMAEWKACVLTFNGIYILLFLRLILDGSHWRKTLSRVSGNTLDRNPDHPLHRHEKYLMHPISLEYQLWVLSFLVCPNFFSGHCII